MRRALAAGAVTLAAQALMACGPVNRFEVVTAEAASARLELCGRSARAMQKTAEGFALKVPADCRGSGRVVVSYPDGAVLDCPVKVVVADMAAWYRFQVKNRTCRIG